MIFKKAKDRELICSQEAVNLNSSAAVSEQKKLLSSKENESLEIMLQLQFAEQKISTYDAHIKHLNERISQLEDDLAKSKKVYIKSISVTEGLDNIFCFQEKNELLSKLRKKEAEVDTLNLQVVNELKAQLRKETQKLNKVRPWTS